MKTQANDPSFRCFVSEDHDTDPTLVLIRKDIPMDTMEQQALQMEREQSARWVQYGKSISFWSISEEQTATQAIRNLKQSSESYQARRGRKFGV